MNEVIKILIERDGMTKKEAVKQFKYVRELIDEANGDYNKIEEIIYFELGLEIDYIMDLLI